MFSSLDSPKPAANLWVNSSLTSRNDIPSLLVSLNYQNDENIPVTFLHLCYFCMLSDHYLNTFCLFHFHLFFSSQTVQQFLPMLLSHQSSNTGNATSFLEPHSSWYYFHCQGIVSIFTLLELWTWSTTVRSIVCLFGPNKKLKNKDMLYLYSK